MNDENPQNEEDLKLVHQHVDALGEHFDTVQIFCTRHAEGERGGTVNVHAGAGNWFARRGHVHQWCIQKDEQARAEVRDEEEES